MAEAATKAPEQVPVEQETNILEGMLETLQTRLARLKPLRDEADRIEATLDAVKPVMDGQAQSDEATPAQETPAPPATPRRRRRRQRRGQRRDEFVQAVKDNPGLKVSGIAKVMGITPNYLYRVMPQVEDEITKRADGTLVPKS